MRVLTAAGSEAVGEARAFVESVKGVGTTAGADVLFLDHAKERYLPDLKVVRRRGRGFARGRSSSRITSCIRARPGYLEYVDSSAGRYETRLVEAMFEYQQVWKGEEGGPKKDALSVSVKRA